MRSLLATSIVTYFLLSPSLIFALSTSRAPQVPQASPEFVRKDFADFNGLRNQLLNLIGRAKQRVVMVTDFLSDGEISTALFLAKYRKLRVTVFLGEKRLNNYLSRVGYLRSQNILTLVRPSSQLFNSPSLLLVDNELFHISRDLNVLLSQEGGRIERLHPKYLRPFQNDFLSRKTIKKRAIPKPLPIVRARPSTSSLRQSPARVYQGEPDGAYNYDKAPSGAHKAPPGLPTQLPKKVKSQRTP